MKTCTDYHVYHTPSQALEDQNAELIDKYAALEEQHAQSTPSKAFVETHRLQIEKLEKQASKAVLENERLRKELETTKAREREQREAREKDLETLAAYEDRFQEYEADKGKRTPRRRNGADGADESASDDEIADLLSGLSVTDLKLQVRKLQRELDRVKAGSSSNDRGDNENASQEAQRLQKRLEDEWVEEHRVRLILESQLDDIANGRSQHEDGYVYECVWPTVVTDMDGFFAVLALRSR